MDCDWVEREYYEYASVWRRVLAGLVDWLLATVVGASTSIGAAIVFALVISGEYSFGTNFGAFLLYFGLPLAFIVVLSWQVVTAFRVSSKGDTIGHRLLGLRVLKADGQRIGRRRALARQFLGSPLLLGYVTPILVLIPVSQVLPQLIAVFAGGLAFIWIYVGLVVSTVFAVANHALMIFDAKWQGWHDKLMGTVVVRELRR